jgi:hypothetical protein
MEYSPELIARDLFTYRDYLIHEPKDQYDIYVITYIDCVVHATRKHYDQISWLSDEPNLFHLETEEGDDLGVIDIGVSSALEYNPAFYAEGLFDYESVTDHRQFEETGCITYINCRLFKTDERYDQISLCEDNPLEYYLEQMDGTPLGTFERKEMEVAGGKRKRD